MWIIRKRLGKETIWTDPTETNVFIRGSFNTSAYIFEQQWCRSQSGGFEVVGPDENWKVYSISIWRYTPFIVMLQDDVYIIYINIILSVSLLHTKLNFSIDVTSFATSPSGLLWCVLQVPNPSLLLVQHRARLAVALSETTLVPLLFDCVEGKSLSPPTAVGLRDLLVVG